jgi:alpha-ketoglutarate-dependent taurine dioxygenase
MAEISGMSADAKTERRRQLAAALAQSRTAEKEIILRDQHEDAELTERLAERIGMAVGAR